MGFRIPFITYCKTNVPVQISRNYMMNLHENAAEFILKHSTKKLYNVTSNMLYNIDTEKYTQLIPTFKN